MQSLQQDIQAARGGEQDAAEKARRALIECDGLLGDLEAAGAWPELTSRVYEEHALAASWLEQPGMDVERTSLSQCMAQIQRALRARNMKEIERHLSTMRRIRSTAYLRHPEAWTWELDHCAARLGECSDPARAQTLIGQARRAEQKGDRVALERSVREIWKLLPVDNEDRALGFNSGVR